MLCPQSPDVLQAPQLQPPRGAGLRGPGNRARDQMRNDNCVNTSLCKALKHDQDNAQHRIKRGSPEESLDVFRERENS